MEYGISRLTPIKGCGDMFQEREIILAFVKDIHPPKEKFFITLYRDDNLNVVACFTTSQHRVPITPEDARHGVIRKENKPVAYMFEEGYVVGYLPESETPFSFAKRTFVPFDYCFQSGTLDSFRQRTDNPKVVGVLSKTEFLSLLYAMYRSPHTNKKYIPLLEKVLKKHSENRED